ncbi:Choline/ethanolamine kinase [Fasciola hepatica]|uniref:Choline/ethanolamine kinase n=1 Tax=Fasciola hepatica TaxID=6192 RepID=A0A4E0R2W8_FASHE|nr:Choline/ethanolamine kinase [Fasciola hepatica]
MFFTHSIDDEVLDEVPCPDFIPQVSQRVADRVTDCVITRLRKQCGKSLAGSWADPENVIVEKMNTCGLSNYLYMAQLKSHVPVQPEEPRKVLIRVYGEVLRSSVDSIVLDSINFAILSEKRIGPALYGVFPGGRIEEFIESRTMTTSELRKSEAMKAVAQQLARIHNLNMPFCKQPRFIFKMMDKFLAQLSGRMDPPSRPPPNLSTPTLLVLEQEYLSDSRLDSVWNMDNFEAIQHTATELGLYKEYEWLKQNLIERQDDAFPVVFCHNDFQENNILVLNNPDVDGFYDVLPIDFEYSGYNFRGFDIGNHFNEWCYDYTCPDPPYFTYDFDSYPTLSQQKEFWNTYLTARITERRTSIDTSKSAGDTLNGSSTTTPHPLEDTKEDFEKLWLEATFGALFSHLFWAAWSLIQSQISSIRFEFSKYASARMDAYYRMKNSLKSRPDYQ